MIHSPSSETECIGKRKNEKHQNSFFFLASYQAVQMVLFSDAFSTTCYQFLFFCL